MNLEQFAKKAGVEIIDCGPGWNGKFGYRTKDSPNTSFCGYRTINSTYESWLKDTFGIHTAAAIKKILSKG
jgi:hypothetical protein